MTCRSAILQGPNGLLKLSCEDEKSKFFSSVLLPLFKRIANDENVFGISPAAFKVIFEIVRDFNLYEPNIPEIYGQALVELRTNVRSDYMYEVRRIFKEDRVWKSVLSDYKRKIQAGEDWAEAFEPLAESLQSPRRKGLWNQWKYTLWGALKKSSRDKAAGISPGIEALALMSLLQYLQGVKRLSQNEIRNKALWKEAVVMIAQDRAACPELELNIADFNEEESDLESDMDPDEVVERIRRQLGEQSDA